MSGLPQGFVLGLVMAMGKGWWWPWGDDGVGIEKMVVVAMERYCGCGHGELPWLCRWGNGGGGGDEMMAVAMGR